MAVEEESGPPRFEIQVVGLQGTIHNALQIYGDENTTVRDLQKLLVQTCGVSTANQRLCVGATVCRPRQLLDDCLSTQGWNKATVTLIKLNPKLRRCQGCGARGRCGATAKLRRCGGCLDTYFCGRHCQTKAWPQHKRHCFRVGETVPSESGVPDELAPFLAERVEGVESQDRGTIHKHDVTATYVAKYCNKNDVTARYVAEYCTS